MVNELKEMMEKKRKIAEIVYIVGMYAMVVGFAIIFIALFQAQAIAKFLDEDHMVNPDMPHSELENATYQITPDDLEMIVDETYDFVIGGLVFFGIGAAIVAILIVVMPNKKQRHMLTCAQPFKYDSFILEVEIKYCPTCGLKMSLLDKK